MPSPNRNTFWASIFVDELAKSGLQAVCIAPGSRSTPLTLAFAQHEAIKVYSHLDERSASFFALGLALASDNPVALVCTSGTATANFYPAIIEAKQSGVPLLILTSDRPHELRHSGANQTIDQINLYGSQVLWSVDAMLPEANPPAVAIRNLRTLAGRAFATANGLRKGAVHINFPFRKPLEPIPVTSDITEETIEAGFTDSSLPFTQFSYGIVQPSAKQIEQLATIIQQHPRGIIVCGGSCPQDKFPEILTQLAEESGYPIFAEPLSGVRFGKHQNEWIIGGYDTFLANFSKEWAEPEVVIRFGNVPTSKVLNTYLDVITPQYRFHINEHGVWADDSHRVTHFLQVNETLLCQELLHAITRPIDREWVSQIQQIEKSTWNVLHKTIMDDWFDGSAIMKVFSEVPNHADIFVANSLPIRHVEQFIQPNNKDWRIFANRGASGIDGTISTALGVGASSERPLYLIIGDLSFYHDMNGLLAVKRCGIDMTIFLMNNNGGGIFYRLPIREFEPPFTELFITPHDLDFAPAIQMYSLQYKLAENHANLETILKTNLSNTVVEIRTVGEEDLNYWRNIKHKIYSYAD